MVSLWEAVARLIMSCVPLLATEATCTCKYIHEPEKQDTPWPSLQCHLSTPADAYTATLPVQQLKGAKVLVHYITLCITMFT